jgi:hypothetical protein
MKALRSDQSSKMKTMERNKTLVQKLHEEFTKFETTMQELQLLKQVATDLKSYRRMMKFKKYD